MANPNKMGMSDKERAASFASRSAALKEKLGTRQLDSEISDIYDKVQSGELSLADAETAIRKIQNRGSDMGKNESLTYSAYRKIMREEAKSAIDALLLEADPVIDTLNANLDNDLIAIRNVKKGKPAKAMIAKALDSVTKPPTVTDPNTGIKKLNSGWIRVKGGLTITNADTDVAKYQKEAQELQAKANEGKGEGDQRYKFVVTIDPTAV